MAKVHGPFDHGLAHCAARVERAVGVLKHHLHPVAQWPQAALRQSRHLVVAPQDAALGRVDQANQAARKGGLARSGLAHNAHGLTCVHRHMGVLQRGGGAVAAHPVAAGVGFAHTLPRQQNRARKCGFSGRRRHARHGRQQLSGVRGLGPSQNLLARTTLNRFALVHHQHLVGDLGHHAHVVGNEKHRTALLALQVGNQLQYFFLRGHVERRGRLVADDQGGLEHHGHGDHDALTLTAAELVRVAAQHALGVGQTHPLKDAQNFGAALVTGPIGVRREQLVDLVTAIHDRIERGHGFLEHHAHAAPAQSAQTRSRGIEQGLALQHDLTTAGAQLLGQQTHHRGGHDRFARA